MKSKLNDSTVYSSINMEIISAEERLRQVKYI